MMRSLLILLGFSSLLVFSAGCTMMSTMRGMASHTIEALRPESFDGWDPGSESTDPWVENAATEGRAHRPVEKEFDPLGLRNILMSSKARDIERNVGIE